MTMSFVLREKRFCIAAQGTDFYSGGRAAAPFFLLLAQKKEGKEKGTLLTRPAAALRFSPLTARKELVAMLLRHLSAFSVSGSGARRVRRETIPDYSPSFVGAEISRQRIARGMGSYGKSE